MYNVYPDYYKDFHCIGGKCKHNCCKGWEIDIDNDTFNYYKTVSGKIGERLKDSISHDDTTHFILGEDGRCPFLNRDNLCDIIIELGEEHICDICKAHPRFKNELPDRTENGIGLTCEEAARIILTKKEKTALCGAPETDDEIIILRDRIINVLQNREKTIKQRVEDMLSLASAKFWDHPISFWKEALLSLERLDEKWTHLVEMLDDRIAHDEFDRHMADRMTEYEQLLVYLIYRHFANAPDLEEAAARAAFAALVYKVIYSIGATLLAKNGAFSVEEQIDICRMFSSEIEYSDENIYILLDELGTSKNSLDADVEK